MKRVLPTGRLVPVPESDSLFNGFFKIDPKDVPGFGAGDQSGGVIYGIYQDNDPTKSLVIIVNYRGILGHHWRWVAGSGGRPWEGNTPSGKAYRLGLNILGYGLSH